VFYKYVSIFSGKIYLNYVKHGSQHHVIRNKRISYTFMQVLTISSPSASSVRGIPFWCTISLYPTIIHNLVDERSPMYNTKYTYRCFDARTANLYVI